MKKIFNWLIDKWLAGFITASIFFILKLYLDLPTETKTNFFSFGWLSKLMETQLSLLTVSIIIFSILILTRIEKAIQKAKTTKSYSSVIKAPKSNFEKYTIDTFGVTKTKWTWHYEWKADEKKFVVAGLKPICKECGTAMRLSTSYSLNSADCHKCRLEGRKYSFIIAELPGDVEVEIIRRIQNNEINS